MLIFIPSYVNKIGRETEKNVVVQKSEEKVISKLPKAAYIGMILQFIYGLGYGAIDNCVSLAAVETGVITTVQAAGIISWGGIASLLGGLFFGKIKDRIGMKVGALSIAMQIIGLAVIGSTATVSSWYVGMTIVKVGFCW